MEFKVGDYLYFTYSNEPYLLLIEATERHVMSYVGLELKDLTTFHSSSIFETAVEVWKVTVVKQSQLTKLLKLQGFEGNEWMLLHTHK